MVAIERLRDWIGTRLYDRGGEEIGEIVDIYYDVDRDEEAFVVVKGGFLNRHRYLVPLDGATASRNWLRARWTKETITGFEVADDALASTDEQAIFEHYELPYEPAANPSGRRLARR